MAEDKAAEKIEAFVVNTDYHSIPPEALRIAKNALLDCIGVTVAGVREPASKILTEHVKNMETKGEAGIIGGGFKATADLAAWVNGSTGHALDYDDTFPNSSGYNFHPTVPILPAILALAERKQASGKEVLTAYICGVEIEFCLGAVIGRSSSEVGWHPTAILGLMGATAASAKMLNLDIPRTRMAIGIASSMTGGLMRNSGTMTKAMHAGNAARNGILAALLAERGFTSHDNILDGNQGFFHIYGGQNISVLTDKLEELGHDWNILSKGIAFKPYPCCRGAHSSIDAILRLREAHHICSDQVAAVNCRTSPRITEMLAFHRPKTGFEGKFSLEYCVAKSLGKGTLQLVDFTDEKVNDPTIQDLMAKVNYEHPKGWPKGTDLTQEVVVSLKNGREYSQKISIPKGEPENPMTEKELLEKFRSCAEKRLSAARMVEVWEMLCNLDSLDRISDLMNLLVFDVNE
jgi:2-methylcitrate dehydratase PrpD